MSKAKMLSEVYRDLGIPIDSVMKLPLTSIIDNRIISIDNCCKIIELNSLSISLALQKGEITIEGQGLYVDLCFENQIVIKGKIEHIIFSDKGE